MWYGRETKPGFMAIDLETRSEVDLGACGVYRYCEGEAWAILLFCYKYEGDADVSLLDLARGEHLPEDVLAALTDPDIKKYAWNAAFERTNLSRYLGERLDPAQWRCTMVWAAELSLPLSLEDAALTLGTVEKKDDAGKALIRKFSQPQKPTKSNGMKVWLSPDDQPGEWARFCDYCRQDVRTEDAIRERLSRFPLPEHEWELYAIDQRINDLGVALDMGLIRGAVACDERVTAILTERARELTGLDNPNSVQQMRGWLAGHGLDLPSLGKELVQEAVEGLGPGDVREALEIRLKLAKSSVKKYEAALRFACRDGRARGLFQFCGAARTGRWSGRGIQLQNLSKNYVSSLDSARELVKAEAVEVLDSVYGNVPDILSQCVRTMLVPGPGMEFIVADFSAIEARCIAWEAGEDWTLKAFEDGKDLYCAMASQMFGVPVEKHGINGGLRQRGKVAVLACIAEGQEVLTDQGLVPIERVTTDMKVWDGEEWVTHEGVVFRGRRTVYKWCGLTATPDHPVRTLGTVYGYTPFDQLWQTYPDKWLCVGEKNGHPVEVGQDYVRSAGAPVRIGLRPTYDIRNAGPRHRYTVSGVVVHNCGYGGGSGAMEAMGALKMGLAAEDLPGIVQAYRDANPHIVQFWRDLDAAALGCIRDHQERAVGARERIRFTFSANTLWMVLPSGRRLAYVGPKVGTNRFGGRSIIFKGVGMNRKWQDIETYGAKLSENCLAGDTMVATRRGWAPIGWVRKGDEVWDGEEWVRCGGAICKGVEEVVTVSCAPGPGIRMTRDHKVLTDGGWVAAGDADGLDWARVAPPEMPYGAVDTGVVRMDVSKVQPYAVPVYDIVDCGPRHRFCVRDPGTGDLRLVHNCTQAIARDLLANAIRNVHEAGIRIVAHVHDEIVAECPVGRYTVDDLVALMTRKPAWAEGLPLAAAGYPAPRYYFKD